MSVLEVFRWLQDTSMATALRESGLAYPIVMTGHLTGMALFGGMIAITDLRLLGWAMRSASITDVVKQLRVWKWIGFVMVVGCGAMLLAAKAELYYYNPFYWTKMTLLLLVGVHALVFHRSVYANTAALDRAPKTPPIAKLAACLSLLLWTGLVSAGRSIAYWDVPPKQAPVYASDRPQTLKPPAHRVDHGTPGEFAAKTSGSGAPGVPLVRVNAPPDFHRHDHSGRESRRPD